MPQQDADYYQAQRDELRPNAYIRFHENKWTSGESVFLTAAMWDAVTDDRLAA